MGTQFQGSKFPNLNWFKLTTHSLEGTWLSSMIALEAMKQSATVIGYNGSSDFDRSNGQYILESQRPAL